ncbi:MAG: hypothetical protein K2N37_06110 [Lachnospiraceae bacterium]|nr:hypothetical protein [Lachnospiraceae bacterium]
MEDRIEKSLKKAATQIVPDAAAQERILEGIKSKKVSRKRLSVRVPAAVLAACMLVGLLWFGGVQSLLGEEIVVYAATEDQGWQKLKEGEKILLKQEHFDIDLPDDEDFEIFDEFGHCNYFPYKCTFRVDVPEDYLYDNSYVGIGADIILQQRDTIEWWLAPERPEDAGKVRQGAFRIWIVSDKIVKGRREHIARLDLELTKEDGKCYAELKRVWESSEYKRNRK